MATQPSPTGAKRSALVQKAMNTTNVINMLYAKIIIRTFTSDRLSFYKKLMALIRNRFSLMDALERMYQIASKDGKNPSDTMALAVITWMKSIQNGATFSVAMRGWAPSSELLMLSVGDIANLELALANTIKVVEGMNRMKGPVINAIAYPMFLIVMVIFLIWGVGEFMVPPMVEAVPDLKWTGLAKSLVDLSYFVSAHPFLLFATLPILVSIIVVTLPFWKGKSRVFFDSLPPWSIYRIFIGLGWLLSLSALVKAGTPVSKAMRALRIDASPYLLYRIDRALVFINNGENLGDALYKTGLNFPDEVVVGDLRIYAELDNFSEALENLSNDWLESSVHDIEQKAAVLNGAAILLIAAVVAWAVMGTFAMQEQMVSGMGLGGG
ncbi:MAG: type II secretion system F family protein [Lactobacillales bacterium]|jgi:type II secretory pathway component PulF|nr:type II secretion system F family protein [Lactobacillales bacterium]